ncbi:MAG: hypothetical protein QOK10_744 [Pseudonocardiales bacterium]|jgi:predicted MFS family arabinose efflux permease|nr:hypothetical protein [Pseudonocardiales bacterium]
MGSTMHVLAAAWLVIHLTGADYSVPTLLLFSALPGVFMAPIVGAVVDKGDARIVLVVTDVVSAAAVLSVPAAHAAGSLSVVQLYAVEAVLAVCGQFYWPASRVLVRDFATPAELLSANSTTTLIYQLGITVGALLGGVLVSIGGPLAGLWVNAASFLVSAIGMTAIRWISTPAAAQVPDGTGPSAEYPDSAQVATDPGGTWRGFVLTLQMIRSRPRIWHLTALYLGLQATQRLMSALLVPFLRSLGLGAGIQGALQMSFGLGSVLAGAVIPTIVRRFGGVVIIGIGSLGVALFMTLFSLTHGAGIAFVLYGALGLAISSWVFSLTQAQLQVPSSHQGTYLATSGSLVSLASLCMFATASLLLSRIDPRPVYWIGAVVLLIVALPSVRYLRRNGFVDRCPVAQA